MFNFLIKLKKREIEFVRAESRITLAEMRPIVCPGAGKGVREKRPPVPGSICIAWRFSEGLRLE